MARPARPVAWKRDQTTLFRQWENYCRIPTLSYGADVLGVSWISYKRYRIGEHRLSLSMRLAMSAIAQQLSPWGEYEESEKA